jgi:hypothetical protein
MKGQLIVLSTLLAWILPPHALGEERLKTALSDPPLLREEQASEEAVALSFEATIMPGCAASFGTRFNRERREDAVPQAAGGIAFIRDRVAPGIDLVVGVAGDSRSAFDHGGGYYVNRDADCAPEFEGGLLVGETDRRVPPLVVADPVRDVFFTVTLTADAYNQFIHVMRSPSVTLLSPTACPGGTHTVEQIGTCWPIQSDPIQASCYGVGDCRLFGEVFLTVDERTRGKGAGNVYVGGSDAGVGIFLVACTNDLQSCSSEVRIDGTDGNPSEGSFGVSSVHMTVRPDGDITFTYIVGTFTADGPNPRIKYVRCIPAAGGAPHRPSCAPPQLVHQETQSHNRLPVQSFTTGLFPAHAHRRDANGIETYVVWDRCKVLPRCIGFPADCFCPDADVVMKASNNDGAMWFPAQPAPVATGAGDQFHPAVTTDRSREIVNIAYYSTAKDAGFHRRARVILKQIIPGGTTPDPVGGGQIITTRPSELLGLSPAFIGNVPFFTGRGPGIGLAARGTGVDGQSRIYIHHTSNSIQGTYSGVSFPDQNNHLSRLEY